MTFVTLTDVYVRIYASVFMRNTLQRELFLARMYGIMSVYLWNNGTRASDCKKERQWKSQHCSCTTSIPGGWMSSQTKVVIQLKQHILCNVGKGRFLFACVRVGNWPFWYHDSFLCNSTHGQHGQVLDLSRTLRSFLNLRESGERTHAVLCYIVPPSSYLFLTRPRGKHSHLSDVA